MTLSRDTSPEAEEVRLGRLRRMSPTERLSLLDACWISAGELVRAGIRARSPGAGPVEVDRDYVRIMLGDALAAAVLAERTRRQHDGPPAQGA